MLVPLLFMLLIASCCSHKPDKCYNFLNSKKQDCCNEKQLLTPCATTTCLSKTQCILHNKQPSSADCGIDYFPLQAKCQEECKTFKCAPGCLPFLNLTRCPDCICEKKCKNPCLKSNPCGSTEECYLQQVTCVAAPCCPVQKCRPKCIKQEKCPDNCLPYIDEYGCKKCHCCNACVAHQCPRGTKCVLNQVQCVQCPCLPVAQCEKDKGDEE